MQGTIPSELGGLGTALINLIGEFNSLTGTVPSELALLGSAQRIFLDGNPGMSGTVPFELCVNSNVGNLELELVCSICEIPDPVFGNCCDNPCP